jgi:hypothetical protein
MRNGTDEYGLTAFVLGQHLPESTHLSPTKHVNGRIAESGGVSLTCNREDDGAPACTPRRRARQDGKLPAAGDDCDGTTLLIGAHV